jgi:GR25 family glycosyltransferase involved in LPS biosynthesis
MLSHYKIWQDQLNNGYKWVLILEDDVHIKNPTSFKADIDKILTNLDDEPLAIFIGQHEAWEISFTDKKLLNTMLGEFTCSVNPCTHAYLVSLEGARLLSESPIIYAADHHINKFLREHNKFYGTRTNMAIQLDSLFGK